MYLRTRTYFYAHLYSCLHLFIYYCANTHMHPCTHTHMHALIHVFVANASLCPKTVHLRRGQTQKNEQLKYNGFVRLTHHNGKIYQILPPWSVCRYQLPAEVAVPAKFPKTWNPFPLEKCSAKSIAADPCAQRSTFAHHTYNTSCQLWPYEIPAKEGQWQQFQKRARGGRTAPHQLRQPYV